MSFIEDEGKTEEEKSDFRVSIFFPFPVHTHTQSNVHACTNKSLYNLDYAEKVPLVFIIL